LWKKEQAGILLGEERSVDEDLKIVKLAENLGYDSVWFGEHVGIRDALVLMGMASMLTERLKVGSCAINAYTRNVGTVAAALNTISFVAPGRVMLGVASGEEILSNYGIKKASPVNEMREFITSLRLLLSGELVNFNGKFINLKNARIERKLEVPVYLAATGKKMLSLGAEIADGVILNFLTDLSYLEEAHRIIGDKRSFQLIAVSLNRDGSTSDAKRFMAKFFYMAPSLFRSSVSHETIERIRSLIKGWPPSSEELEIAEKVVPDEVLSRLMAVGSANEVEEYISKVALKWGSYPIFYIVSKDYEYAMKKLKNAITI
jgi:alkanesulfonate monooxygenase SsuD/methylene tetrahydromethanopterin reductase-like flavin-dependent oxidoreductase (luciferase family)